MSGNSVLKLAKEACVSRTLIYALKEKVKEYALSLDKDQPCGPTITIDKRLIRRIVLSLALDCRSSEEGICRFFENILGIHISVGTVSGILKEACRRAKEWDKQVWLSRIRQGANDEIFQGSRPVMIGIDPETDYIYLMEPMNDRSTISWLLALGDCKSRGLDLKVNISDGGAGLKTGVQQAFPHVVMQPDVFHALRSVGMQVASLTRKTYSLLEKEAELERKAAGKRPWKRTLEELEALRGSVQAAVQNCDTVSILFHWLTELSGYSGYPYEQALELAEWVISEMTQVVSGSKKFQQALETFRRGLPDMLYFLKRMEAEWSRASQTSGIPVKAFRLFYQEKAYPDTSWYRSELEYKLGAILADRYEEAKAESERIIQRTKRASSMVENCNSRVRPYMDLKRMIPDGFFILLKVYLNTRKYRRSTVPEHKGKSPIELLTGKEYPEFLDVLGF